ncbi:MAG: hypothetical protein H6756_07730 [Candidatus Omnitrophica bacterium]|nr:hypothetical protein [Candidatus Omnitrophota bacterium]MCB9720750.1 hypothetical protein [Candidatus Omnitrophota bacterium]
MESTLNVPLSEGQLFLAMILQTCLLVWFIVFPIILIRKLNYLIAMIEDKFYPENESPSE